MKKENRSYQLYLDDIQLAMNRIAEYIQDMEFEQFRNDYKTIDAVIRNFEIIGEASKNIKEAIKEKYPEVPWYEMYSLRNVVTHEYFGVDHEIIWDIAKKHLPANKVQIDEIVINEKNS